MNTQALNARLIIIAGLIISLVACAAQTRYADVPVSSLSDEQLIEELMSAAEGLGIELNRTTYLMAVRPDPAYVLTSSSTFFSGISGASYTAYSMPMGYGLQTTGTATGMMSGTATTQYQYTDVNAAGRLLNSLALAISRARSASYRQRALDVLEEYETRTAARRRETEAIIEQFFMENPNLESRRLLVAAVTPWVASEGRARGRDTLKQAKEIIETLPQGDGLSGTWYGLFSQTTTLNNGQSVAFSEFVRIDMNETDGNLTGKGMLGTGEVVELVGRVDGDRVEATVSNITSGINVSLSAIAVDNQMTAEFSGFGAGQRLSGTVLLLR